MPFIPHTDVDIKKMLETIGVQSIDDLWDEIPQALQIGSEKLTDIPVGLTEYELSQKLQSQSALDQGFVSYLGAGAYEHSIPAAVFDVMSRGEWMTAYTPYQAEASQGTLQLIYEFQTNIASITGMEVANASLYDGATALAEAVLMAVRCNRKCKTGKVLIPNTVHPHYLQVVKTIVLTQGIEIIEVDFCDETGQVTTEHLEAVGESDFVALVIPFPNFFGVWEQVDALTDWAHSKNALVVGVVNPLACMLAEPPGAWGETGADIVVGEGQPLGIPLASGGPYYGFMCAKQAYVRQMPGRIIGKTEDLDGKTGYVLTLQAREQHIRRSKATSNICTNQGLMVTASTIHMAIMGANGLQQAAQISHHNTISLAQKMSEIPGVSRRFDAPVCYEVALSLPVSAKAFCQEMLSQKILAGVKLGHYYDGFDNVVLVSATEARTSDELDQYVIAAKHAIERLS